MNRDSESSGAHKQSEQVLQTEHIHPELMAVVARLRNIQHEYGKAVAQLRREQGIGNRGCGPGAYALAIIAQEQLNLPIDANFSSEIDNTDGIHIVFGLEQERDEWTDHAWVEVTYKGQSIIISHESQRLGVAASYRVGASYVSGLDETYNAIGFRRLSEESLDALGLSEEQLSAAREIVDQINAGTVPEMYQEWFQCLMTQLSS